MSAASGGRRRDLGRIADYQPFTPVNETVRGLLMGTLLMGTPIGDSAIIAVAWCAGIALVGHMWAKWLYDRDPVR